MKNENNKIFPVICITTLAAAFIYGLVLPFCWGNDPLSETGTLSLLCEHRQGFFWVWGLLTCGSIALNTEYMYKKFMYKNKFLDVLCIMSVLSVCLVALTLDHSIADWNPKRIAHWVATGMYIAFTLAPIALFFIINIKRYKNFSVLLTCAFLIFGTFVFIFAVIGKCALMEMVPLALLEIYLFIINFTPLIKVQKLS